MKATKFLTKDETKEQIYDDVLEKKALPELQLKFNIITAQESLLLSERRLMFNFRQSNRFFKEDIINFEGDLVLLWSFIRQMVEDQGISKDDRRYFDILLALEVGTNNFRVKDLIFTKNFLNKCLHKINITNLFQSKDSNYDTYLKNI